MNCALTQLFGVTYDLSRTHSICQLMPRRRGARRTTDERRSRACVRNLSAVSPPVAAPFFTLSRCTVDKSNECTSQI
ncbi:hypothetical protein EVAR_37058_1 [Eumeta japonica]|uniref:Uncharacterized protein n=1 Tax=Eumeta variegata TaxID=151549 RepID=A0A4C1WFW4_EUMVA|nr:hypothetical protein EVAR_37058_1 [Eumeta japonica]